MLHFFAKPLSGLQVWAVGTKLWLASFTKVQPLALLFMAWLFVPLLFIFGIKTSSTFLGHHNVNLALLLLTAGHGLVSLVFYNAIYYRLYHVLHGKPDRFGAVFVRSIKKLVVLVPASIFAMALLILGYSFLILPGIYLTIVFLIYYPLIVLDNLSPLDALKRSSQLVKGKRWWQTAAVVVIPTLLYLLLDRLIEHFTLEPLIKILATYQIQFTGLQDWFFQQIIKFVLLIFYFPFFSAIVVTQFQNLKIEQVVAVNTNPNSPEGQVSNG